MIISDFKVRRFEFPPIDHGIPDQHNGTIRSNPGTRRVMNIVQVTANDGTTGICPGRNYLWDKTRWKRILGEDPFSVERIWQKMYMGDYRKPVAKGEWLRNLSKVDIAIWDLIGKAAGKPVYKLLGGYADRIPVYAAGGYYREDKGIDDLAEELKGFVDHGFTAVKMKVGAWRFGVSMETDIERVRAAREAVGPDVKLMVDANNAWDAKNAIKFIKAVECYDPYWFEEPVVADDFRGSAEVKNATSVLVASGENEMTRWGSRDLIDSRAVDVIQTDPALCGGFTEIRKIAAMASAQHIWFAPHGGRVLGATAVCSMPNGLIVESYPLSQWRVELPLDPENPEEKLLEEPNPVVNSWIEMSQEPGLGYKLNEDVAEKYEVKDR
jgi:L-alanine-DL-glutamate epimerase-like enolase superfamily enzyme